MRGAMAAVCWRRLALLLVLGVCSVSLSAASTLPIDGLNRKSQDYTNGRLRHRSLLQAAAPTPPAAVPVPPPAPVPVPPPRQPPAAVPATPPVARAPGIAPVLPPSPPRAAPAPPTPVRTYLMWVGIGAAILVIASVAVFCLCRKFGQNKISRGQRLPPLPRYH